MSDKKDIEFFELLKAGISTTLRKKHEGCKEEINLWKGNEIKLFQQHLEEKIHGRISEKWFYTHLKSNNDKLPRIDILNMLSRYCDYEDWMDFKSRNKRKHSESKRIYMLFLPIVILTPLIWYAFASSNYRYKIDVIDAITLRNIPAEKLELVWLKKGESPILLQYNERGEFLIETDQKEIELIVKSPYYFTDTIKRILPSKMVEETVVLRPDDYALMINIFSRSKVREWEKRREKLESIFAPNVSIIQVDENGMGMEIYNKEDFIDKLSYPYSQLKNIEVLETRLYKGKIVFLRFKIH